jgi:hypothetical protein
MRSKLAASAVAALAVIGLTTSSAHAVYYTSASTATCKERGYTTILKQKGIYKGSTKLADVYITYNKSKTLTHCIVMRSRSGNHMMAVGAGAANFVDSTRALYSSGASGSMAFSPSGTTRQWAGIYYGSNGYYEATFSY